MPITINFKLKGRRTMKRIKNYFIAFTFAITLCALGGCGLSAKEDFTTSVEQFSQDIENVVSKPDELEGLAFEPAEMSDGGESATMIVKESGSDIGFYFLSTSDNSSLNMVTATFGMDVKGKSYKKMLNAAWMTFDPDLTYEEAAEITDEIDNILIFGGESIEKNNIKYSGSAEVVDDMVLVTAVKNE